ncbi:hypothetical protein ES332_D09G006800v1 [Gossypium tomentosum]|uniref:Reverse transcriptase zinc-binding domain-containing protein n=1 Tax=Gossypium tomentosum TaxID=34277 RepID=A0A5D2JCJ1_GOSTO|nr:hypothetical protein ES332_D09G006800v1 [Gossypium tomentosum]
MHWSRWADLCKPKAGWGMGFHDLYKFNIALLAKQWWHFLVKFDMLAAHIFKSKYYPSITFWNAQLGTGPSYVWRSIFVARKLMENEVGWSVGSGMNISIWRDSWLLSWAGGRIQNTLVNNFINKVAYLIDTNTKTWNMELITSVFNVKDAVAIKCILLSHSIDEARLTWKDDKCNLPNPA